MEHGSALFHIFGLRVSSYVVSTWVIMLLLAGVSYLATRKMKMVPTGAQNVMEYAVGSLQSFFSDILGEKHAKRFLPLLATLFLFILVSNYSGLLPLSGHLPGLAAPTSTISVTLGLSLIVFVFTFYVGFKEHGLGFFKHYFKPFAFLFPLMILEEIVRPVSLSLRLYGNIFGEEMIAGQLFNMFSYFVPILMQLLAVLFGFIQAFVFVLLTAIYLMEAIHSEE